MISKGNIHQSGRLVANLRALGGAECSSSHSRERPASQLGREHRMLVGALYYGRRRMSSKSIHPADSPSIGRLCSTGSKYRELRPKCCQAPKEWQGICLVQCQQTRIKLQNNKQGETKPQHAVRLTWLMRKARMIIWQRFREP